MRLSVDSVADLDQLLASGLPSYCLVRNTHYIARSFAFSIPNGILHLIVDTIQLGAAPGNHLVSESREDGSPSSDRDRFDVCRSCGSKHNS